MRNWIRPWLGEHRPSRPSTGAGTAPLWSAGTEAKRSQIRAIYSDLRMQQLILAGDHYRHAFADFRDDMHREPDESFRARAHATFSAHPELAPAYLLHRNGFVRQAAITGMTVEHLSAFALLLLFFRCNDWVEPVRENALAKTLDLLPQAPPHMLESLLPVLVRRAPSWTRYRRHPTARPVDLLDRALDIPEFQSAAIKSLRAIRFGPTTRIFYRLARYDWLDPHLESLSRDARTIGVKRAAMAALLQGELRWQTGPRRSTETMARALTVETDALKLFRQAAGDRAATIRALAADALIRQGPDDFPLEDWQPLTRDTRPAVQARMAFFHRKWVTGDLPDYLKPSEREAD